MFKSKYWDESEVSKAFLIALYSTLIEEECPNPWVLAIYHGMEKKELEKLLQEYRKKYENYEQRKKKEKFRPLVL